MFTKKSPDGFKPALEGIQLKTLVYGDTTLMAEFHLEKGHTLPVHSHPHEQTGYLIQGRIRLTMGDEVHDVHPGDSWCIAGGLPHGAEVIADAIAIEVFHPVRDEYLPEQA